MFIQPQYNSLKLIRGARSLARSIDAMICSCISAIAVIRYDCSSTRISSIISLITISFTLQSAFNLSLIEIS